MDRLDKISRESIEEFMRITEADFDTANEYLNRFGWQTVEAINQYFEVMFQENQDQEEQSQQQSTDLAKRHHERDDFPVNNTEPRLFQHVTYNIDGLCEKNLTLRIKAICEILIREKVTIAFLQEVRSNSEEIIRENLEPSYEIFSGYNSSADYYTLTLIAKKPYIRVIQSEVINFKQTQMGRNILLVELRIDDAKLLLINTHLESTKESKSIRMQQLVKLFQILQKKDLKELSIIVAGDLNLRDKELDEIGGLPSGVVDAWIATGKRPEVQYTWDMRRNDNEKFYEKNTNFKPRMRFDRVFFRPSQPTKIDLIHFGLIGLERLKPHTCFPSDHWGVITSYQIYLNKI